MKSFYTFIILSLLAFYSYSQNNTPYIGLGTNVSLSKLSFKSSKGEAATYFPQTSWNQSMFVGLLTVSGFTQELEVARQTFIGENKDWIGHRIEIEQIQARLSLGYHLQKKINWNFLAGVYWGRNIRNVNEFLILPLDFVSSDLEENDFGLHFKIAPVFGKGEYLKVSPYFNALVGLNNLEGEMDADLGQVTRLNAGSIGINFIYSFTK